MRHTDGNENQQTHFQEDDRGLFPEPFPGVKQDAEEGQTGKGKQDRRLAEIVNRPVMNSMMAI
ncbi:MAG: hypothetical protein R3B54_17525 [Bdellovibrionota bacterium]